MTSTRTGISSEGKSSLLKSLHSSSPVSKAGLTHSFYRYPARMPPELAREVIGLFTTPGGIVLDPFMGGGTSVVEAIACGRRAVGIDVNSLATFIAEVKTTPLSPRDEEVIRKWASGLDLAPSKFAHASEGTAPEVTNLGLRAQRVFGRALLQVDQLPKKRQQRFGRCCLLRVGQWCMDGKSSFPARSELKSQLLTSVEAMLAGLRDLVSCAREHGYSRRDLTARRVILHRSSVDAHTDTRLESILGKAELILTSPPYPSVHVLYNRWQVAGRRETPAPYWFIGESDGNPPSYYTMGTRARSGRETYYRMLVGAYRSMRSIMHPRGMVVQVVSFYDPDSQLPEFLQAMETAGFEEAFPISTSRDTLWRTVPNRSWYNRTTQTRRTRKELLLFHVPRSDRASLLPRRVHGIGCG